MTKQKYKEPCGCEYISNDCSAKICKHGQIILNNATLTAKKFKPKSDPLAQALKEMDDIIDRNYGIK